MTTTILLIFTILAPLLLALENAMRASTAPVWLKVPAMWRAVIVVVVGALAGVANVALTSGVFAVQDLILGLAAALPAIVRIVFGTSDQGEAVKAAAKSAAKAAIVALFLGGTALAQTGCAGSLEETRAQARIERLGPVAIQSDARPPQCAGIDSRRQLWTGVLWTGAGVAAGAAAGGIIASKVQDLSPNARANWGLGLAVAGATGTVGAGVGTAEMLLADDAWARECQ